MPLNSLQLLILEVLEDQSEGYLCSEYSSAFVAVGLEDREELRQVLISLQDSGLVEFFTEEEETTVVKVEKDERGKPKIHKDQYVPILDEEGNIQTEVVTTTVDAGWVITEAGRLELTS